MFVIFCFGYNEVESAWSRFNYYFSSTQSINAVYNAKDIPVDVNNSWRLRGVPYLRATSTLELFAGLIRDDMVLVNVNKGVEITHLGLVGTIKNLLIIVSSRISCLHV